MEYKEVKSRWHQVEFGEDPVPPLLPLLLLVPTRFCWFRRARCSSLCLLCCSLLTCLDASEPTRQSFELNVEGADDLPGGV